MTLALSPFTILFGQYGEVDTVFVKRSVGINEFEVDTLFIPSGRGFTQVLTGTMFIPYSEKIITLLNEGLMPLTLEIVDACDDTSDPSTFGDYPKLVSASNENGILTIDVSVVANCCHNFLGEAEFVGPATLNLLYTTYGGFCGCECCFTLRYKFEVTVGEDYPTFQLVSINGSETIGEIKAE